MKRLIQIALLLAPLSLVAQTSNVVLPQDKGPDKINVSAYPAPQQAAYKTFSSKCSKCHTISRPINTMMKRDEWERYVKRMMHKPNSGISDNQGKQIFEFLVFDQTERKDKNPTAFFPALSDEEIDKLKKK
ncbi:MAG: photosystem P840 reaction-center cytochrome c-551 [Candidatus Sulfopaludibacter sp.]|nr:photosystem P840 reaction-center cytochrome c-551 [Candidatus Sulfopaludibacter sp.]